MGLPVLAPAMLGVDLAGAAVNAFGQATKMGFLQ